MEIAGLIALLLLCAATLSATGPESNRAQGRGPDSAGKVVIDIGIATPGRWLRLMRHADGRKVISCLAASAHPDKQKGPPRRQAF